MEQHLDCAVFYEQKTHAWESASDYWLSHPLRHVDDMGDEIWRVVQGQLTAANSELPVLLDVGFGSGWLADRIACSKVVCRYIGVDCNQVFVEDARKRFAEQPWIQILQADLEHEPLVLVEQPHVVVCAFSLFEMLNLNAVVEQTCRDLAASAWVNIFTIDRLCLLWALASSCSEFRQLLCWLDRCRSTPWAFQRIDTGEGLHATLRYPSVLHRMSDYVDACAMQGLALSNVREFDFLQTEPPKIYQHLCFRK